MNLLPDFSGRLVTLNDGRAVLRGGTLGRAVTTAVRDGKLYQTMAKIAFCASTAPRSCARRPAAAMASGTAEPSTSSYRNQSFTPPCMPFVPIILLNGTTLQNTKRV